MKRQQILTQSRWPGVIWYVPNKLVREAKTKCRWAKQDEDSSSETDVQWTPALSDYESATDEDESQQYLEYSEYHLHTNSPAWAALFPLPDSPETVADDLPQCAPEVLYRTFPLFRRFD